MLERGSEATLRTLSGSALVGPADFHARRAISVPLPARLAPSEVRRRLLHMLPGLLPFVLWFIPHPSPWGPLLANAVLLITISIVAPALWRFSAFSRPGESDGKSSVLGYALPILAALCLFRGREEIGMMTLAILAFGDGSATLGGLTLGGQPLPWNRKKTNTGLAFFLVIGGAMATIVFWGESQPGISWNQAIVVGFCTTTVAAFAESVRSRINDNLRVGLVALVIGAVLHRVVIS